MKKTRKRAGSPTPIASLVCPLRQTRLHCRSSARLFSSPSPLHPSISHSPKPVAPQPPHHPLSSSTPNFARLSTSGGRHYQLHRKGLISSICPKLTWEWELGWYWTYLLSSAFGPTMMKIWVGLLTPLQVDRRSQALLPCVEVPCADTALQ